MIQHATNNSLVLIDELGRGTSVVDATALTISILEQFAERMSFVCVVTHFPAVADYFLELPFAMLLHLQVSQDDDRMNYQFVLKPGKSRVENYGIGLAQRLGFPQQLLVNASEISNRIMLLHRERHDTSPAMIARKERDYKKMVFSRFISRLSMI